MQPLGQGASVLTISNVQAADAGRYAVIVTNSVNRFPGVTSSNAILNVLGPLVLVDFPRGLTVEPGADVRFEVAAAGTPPLLNLTDENYRLNPLNLTTDLPRDRMLAVSLQLNF